MASFSVTGMFLLLLKIIGLIVPKLVLFGFACKLLVFLFVAKLLFKLNELLNSLSLFIEFNFSLFLSSISLRCLNTSVLK